MTAREEVIAKRVGFVTGCYDEGPDTRGGCTEKAKRAFPMPKTIKQRVVTLRGFDYRVDANGVVEWANAGAVDWEDLGTEPTIAQNLDKLQVVVDLLQRPTEEVDDE